MTRVMHLIETGGPGGAESVFATLVADGGSSGSFGVGPCAGWAAQSLRERGRTPLFARSDRAFDLSYMRRLAGYAGEHQAQALCAHMFGAAAYGALLSAWLRLPLVSVLHGAADMAANARFFGVKKRLVRRYSKRVVFVSRNLRDEFAPQLGLAPAAAQVIYNGVDVNRLTPAHNDELRQRLNLPAQAILIGSLGNLRPAKGYDTLLNAAQLVCRANADIHFVVAGDPKEPLQGQLLAQRAQLGLAQCVHFLGMLHDTATYLNGLDLFVLSSDSEGFSIACVEAMACGLPVIATRCGGPEEIIVDGESGVLVERKNPAALAEAILGLISDPQRAERLRGLARRRAVETFSLQSSLDAYRALFDEVAGQ